MVLVSQATRRALWLPAPLPNLVAVRTHGWGGSPPASDQEARARIVRAAIACIDEHGAAADVAKVATRLRITRQTVYRYFPSRRALFETVGAEATGPLVSRLRRRLRGIGDPADAVVELVFWCIRNLPRDPRLAFIASTGHGDALIMAPQSPQLAAAIVERLPIDLTHLDVDRRSLLVEHMLRLVQALLLDASTANRSDADLRRFLGVCLRPSVHPKTIRG